MTPQELDGAVIIDMLVYPGRTLGQIAANLSQKRQAVVRSATRLEAEGVATLTRAGRETVPALRFFEKLAELETAIRSLREVVAS